MRDIYTQFRDFHIFKKFKHLLRDWWNIDILVVAQEEKKLFYDSLSQLNNPLVRNLLESPPFKKHFLRSIYQGITASSPPQLLPWRQTGLDLFITPLILKNSAVQGALVATGFAPKKEKELRQSLLYLGFSKKAVERDMAYLKKLSASDEVYIQKMLKILAEECFALLTEKEKNRQIIKNLNQVHYSSPFIIGQSPAMQYLMGLLEKIKNYEGPLLIEGEKGAGKKLFAKTIHTQSPRSKKAFYSHNFSMGSGKFLDLEIFKKPKRKSPRYKKRMALREKLNGGSLFLNEIDQASLKFQSQLAQFFKKNSKEFDMRILFGTSQNLKKQVKEKQFNKELYKMISKMRLKIPPLRERKEDIPLLVRHFLKIKNPLKQGRFSAQAMSRLYNYPWPGNARELEMEIKKIISLSRPNQNIWTEQNLSAKIKNPAPFLNNTFQPGKKNLKAALRSFEKQILLNSLRKTNWNKTRVAELLGSSRTSIVLKVKEYGLLEKEGA